MTLGIGLDACHLLDKYQSLTLADATTHTIIYTPKNLFLPHMHVNKNMLFFAYSLHQSLSYTIHYPHNAVTTNTKTYTQLGRHI